MVNEETKQQVIEFAKLLLTHRIAPAVTCEACGTVLPTHSDALNIMQSVRVGVPGHGAIPSFQCPFTEHWACSIECWQKIAHDCIDNHLTPLLQHAHERVGRATPVKQTP